jgi:hypothetical protein
MDLKRRLEGSLVHVHVEWRDLRVWKMEGSEHADSDIHGEYACCQFPFVVCTSTSQRKGPNGIFSAEQTRGMACLT